MRILYGIQGTGNGHLSRARTLLPELRKFAEVDVLISGNNHTVPSSIKPDYQSPGLSYTFGQDGGISVIDTICNLRPVHFVKDIYQLPVASYDGIISDFDPVTSRAAYLSGVPSIGISHQASFLSGKVPRPKSKKWFPELLFSRFARCDRNIGLHYRNYDDHIFTPIIRPEIRKSHVSRQDHITVYHPAYLPETIAESARHFTELNWHIFSRMIDYPRQEGHLFFYPANPGSFARSMASSSGLITAGGFETTAEALHLGKRLMVIPMKGQYEQQCNGAALSEFGAVLRDDFNGNLTDQIKRWMALPEPDPQNYPEVRGEIVQVIMNTLEIIKRSKTYRPGEQIPL